MKKQKYYITGSTHIDLAWKKSKEELAELLEIFVIRLLDALECNPEFTYVLEQAYHYRSLNERRPDLVQKLKKFIQEGRLEFVGGMASTMETNMPNGESFVRNQLLGMKWVRENFGINIRTGWLIDTFGLNAQIPQILRQFGIRHLLANRFGGTKYHDIFIDKGLDGSKILIAGKDVYSGYVRAEHVFFDFIQSWEDTERLFSKASEKHGTGPILIMPYTENETYVSLHLIHRVDSEREKGKREDWGYSIPADFFKALDEMGETWPVENGDLNPEFTATFSQRINIRIRNRRVENLLLESEKWVLLQRLDGFSDLLEQAWWLMAFIHFHDVFTGSHPTNVYMDVMNCFDKVETVAVKLLEEASLSPCNSIVENGKDKSGNHMKINVFNGLPFSRKDIIEVQLVSGDKGCGKVVCKGRELPFEVKDGYLRILADFPAVSINTVEVEKGNKGRVKRKDMNSSRIENEFILLECDNQVGIKRLEWKPTGKVLLENADDFLVIQRDEGSFQIEMPCGSEVTAGAGILRTSLYETSPVCSRLSLEGVFPKLSWAGPENFLGWEAEFYLIPGKPILYLKLKVNWKGECSRIRMKLSTCLEYSKGVYEIPFGVVTRKPYGSRGTARGEWPAQRFTAVENAKYGLALINTGVPGVEIADGTIWTTILRSPKAEYAGMLKDDSSSQHGSHIFQFAMVPYQGNWEESGIVRFAQEMNSPLLPIKSYNENLVHTGATLLNLEPANLVLSTVKIPEDESDEVIVRFYESTGKEVMGSLWVASAEHAWVSDMKETKFDMLDCCDGRIRVPVKPFEIKTIRIRRYK